MPRLVRSPRDRSSFLPSAVRALLPAAPRSAVTLGPGLPHCPLGSQVLPLLTAHSGLRPGVPAGYTDARSSGSTNGTRLRPYPSGLVDVV